MLSILKSSSFEEVFVACFDLFDLNVSKVNFALLAGVHLQTKKSFSVFFVDPVSGQAHR